MARARCCVTISSGAFGPHSPKFVQPPVVKALHGQSEQYLARGVNTNRPSRLQFAQSAANAEVFLVAKQGRVCRRVRGVHLQDFLLLGAFVEHRKS